MLKRALPIFATLALLPAAGCRLASDLLPRTHTTSTSPDGRYYAFVRQQLNSDPPDDHLYLGPTSGRERHLLSLAPDADWCRTILWSPDSRTVGFLINEQRLAVFDVHSVTVLATLTLVEADGYPGSQEARNVSLANDGVVRFERFVRPTMLLRTGVETPVTWHGTYGRPIHKAERSLGVRELRVDLKRPNAGI